MGGRMNAAALQPPLHLSHAAADRLRDGILYLDAHGRVSAFNPAAQAWVRACEAESKTLAGLIDKSRRGGLPLPIRLGLFSQCETCPKGVPEVWLDRDCRQGFVLLVIHQPDAEGVEVQSGAVQSDGAILAPAMPGNVLNADFMSLLGKQTIENIRHLSRILAELKANPGALSDPENQEKLASASQCLGQVGDLAELYQQDEVFADERFGLAPLLAELIPQLPRRTGPDAIRYVYQEGENIGQIYGHRRWLKQAIFSLLGQMGEGCPPGYGVQISLRQLGDFVVVTGRVLVDRDHLTATQKSHIASASLKRASTPTGTEQGFGLRLPLCQRIVDLHGGTLGVVKIEDSATPQLESFMLSLATGLPTHDRSRVSCADCRIRKQSMVYALDLAADCCPKCAMTYPGQSVNAANDGGQNNAILIVDDHPEIRQLVRLLLQRNYTLLEAENGSEALEMVRRHRPAIVLLDVMMPGEIDGLQALRIIKNDPEIKNTYVIMLTARGQVGDQEFATRLGCNAYFVKPFSPMALESHISAVLNARSLAR